jgi:hypothetical protein
VIPSPGEGGHSLPEAVLALALMALLLTASLPALASGLSRGRVAAAAREMAGEMARLRSEAIATRRRVALRIAWSGGRYVYTFHADGDGDGVRSDDIAAGRDPLLLGPRDLPSRHAGVDFGLLDAAIPEVPPARGVLAPQSDPVRFGASDIVTFTPWGTSSTGTLYVSDGRASVQAVVLYGRTGRIRIWRFDRALWRWAQ